MFREQFDEVQTNSDVVDIARRPLDMRSQDDHVTPSLCTQRRESSRTNE
jgi:hypothetical protein